MNPKPLKDELATIAKAMKILPHNELKVEFLEFLSELEDNACHKNHSFPKSNLRKVQGIEGNIYRADIKKQSCFRLHVKYCEKYIQLCDVLDKAEHDNPTKSIKAKKARY